MRQVLTLVFIDIPLKVSDGIDACFQALFCCIGWLVGWSVMTGFAWLAVCPLFGLMTLIFQRSVSWESQVMISAFVGLWACLSGRAQDKAAGN